MTDFLITAPDGKKYKVSGTSKEGAVAALQKMLGQSTPQSVSKIETPSDPKTVAKAPNRADAYKAARQAPEAPAMTVAKDVIKAGAAGAVRGAAGLVGLPGTIGDLMDKGAVAAGIMKEAPGSVLSGASLTGALSGVTGGATDYRGQTTPGKYAGTVGEFIGGGAGAKVGIAAGLGSEAAGQLTEGTSAEPWARMVGALAGGLAEQGLEGILGAVKASKAQRAFIEAAPETAALRSQADALYDAGRANGAVATPQQVGKLSTDMNVVLRNEGAIGPTGRIASAYPKVKDAVRMVKDYAGSTMTPTEMLQVRKTLTAAARSADGSEARLGTIMLQKFDDFTSALAPEIAEANAVYRTMSQGKLIETTVELAGSRAGQFSGSGFENALRTEFRALERKIIKGQVKASADEAAMISKIARGGTWENIARDIGKAAPRGVVSTGMSGGVPFLIGNAMGGPAVGAAAGITSLAAGEIGRRVATGMQTSNANMLSAIARSGGNALAAGPNVPVAQNMLRLIPGIQANR